MPTTAGIFNFGVRVVDGQRMASGVFRLEVAPAPVEILPDALPDPHVGVEYQASLSLDGAQGTVTWSLIGGMLPTGMSLRSDGVVHGVPIVIGRSTARIRAAALNKTRERDLTVRVLPPQLSIQTVTLPNGNVGARYAAQLERRGGDSSVVWELLAGALPAGMTLSRQGMLEGTPTSTGVQEFTVSAFSDPQRATQRLRLEIDPPFTYPRSATVDMPGDFFTPAVVYLERDGVVTWRFMARPHNVVFAAIPGAPESIPIVSNVTISRAFPVAGTFRYDCTIHPGMSGIVVVGRP